jgi:hypothetical protein
MCKILLRRHACGHHNVLKQESHFLVKNKFQCADEEREQVRDSRHDCTTCRRRHRQMPKPTAVPSTPKRLDSATIIANLKALCAQVAAQQHAEAVPKFESILDASTTDETGERPTLPVSTEAEPSAAEESATASQNQRDLRMEPSGSANGFSKSTYETDPDAHIPSPKTKPRTS